MGFRTDAEAETPILRPPHEKSWLIGKDPDAGRDWGQEEKGMTEDEMAGWHHQLDGHEFGWTPGVGDGQGGLACCDSWLAKSRTRLSDWTELNWTEDPLLWPQLLSHVFLFLFCMRQLHQRRTMQAKPRGPKESGIQVCGLMTWWLCPPGNNPKKQSVNQFLHDQNDSHTFAPWIQYPITVWLSFPALARHLKP